MTTIAWDGKMLASDKQITSDDKAVNAAIKIARREDGALIGIAGTYCTSAEYMRWFLDGEKGEKPSLNNKLPPDTSGGSVLIIRKDGSIEDHDRDGWHHLFGKVAIGSGGALASLAMRMGASAKEAVLHASEFDIYSGGGVDTLEFGK